MHEDSLATVMHEVDYTHLLYLHMLISWAFLHHWHCREHPSDGFWGRPGRPRICNKNKLDFKKTRPISVIFNSSELQVSCFRSWWDKVLWLYKSGSDRATWAGARWVRTAAWMCVRGSYWHQSLSIVRDYRVINRWVDFKRSFGTESDSCSTGVRR